MQQQLVAAFELDVDELRRADRAVGFHEGAERRLALVPDEEAGRASSFAAEQAPGALLHPVEQRAQRDRRRGHLEHAADTEAAAEHPRATRIGPQRILDNSQREPALEHLDRRRPDRAGVRTALRAVAVLVRSAAPAAALELVMRPILARFGMRAAHQQTAGGAALVGADLARHGLGHCAENAGDDPRLAFGVAGDTRRRKYRIDQRTRRRDHPDRPERAGIERHVVSADALQDRGTTRRRGSDIGGVDRPPCLFVRGGKIDHDLVVADMHPGSEVVPRSW